MQPHVVVHHLLVCATHPSVLYTPQRNGLAHTVPSRLHGLHLSSYARRGGQRLASLKPCMTIAQPMLLYASSTE
eukprot:31164-Eustigmatos_ZCMA.PRE.1